jgi:hypothetical protein
MQTLTSAHTLNANPQTKPSDQTLKKKEDITRTCKKIQKPSEPLATNKLE